MGIFSKLFNYFKNEIKLNKEYYESLEKNEREAEVEALESPIDESYKPHPVPQKEGFQKNTAFNIEYSFGHIVRITPEPQWGENYYDILDQIRSVTSIISDGQNYDLTDVNSIYSIHVSVYSKPENDYRLSSYGTLEYLLQEKGNSYSRWTQRELGLACLRKAIELMKISDVKWDRRDFQRIVWRLKEFGAEEDASKLEQWYKGNVLTDEQEAELILSGKIDKELSHVQKEIIMVKRVTKEDMLQFTGMPYRFDFPIKKHIEHGSHPSAYMELSPFNQEVAKSDLSRLNEIIRNMAGVLPSLTSKFFLQIDKVMFSEYDSSYGYSTLICTPHTFTGKISKFPLTLSFMTRMDVRTYSATGQLLYNESGILEKATVNVWRAPSDYSHPGAGWGFSFGTFESKFILGTAETTLVPDEYGRPTIIYRCRQIIDEENKRAINRAIFEWMQKHLPDDCPKSISGFSRMRNSNSKNYQALVKKAEAAGFVFPQTLEDVAKWPENQ